MTSPSTLGIEHHRRAPALSRTALWAVLVLLPLAAVGAALVSQHTFDMQPCPWCVLQRVIFVAMALVAAPALLLRQALPRRLLAGAALLLAVAGMAAALWQHFVAASSTSCNLTLADRIVGGLGLDGLAPAVFAAYASCADAAVKLVGLPYEFWSLALYVLLAVLALRLLRRPA
jgi:protein dithiol:quinone oxidoreductase